MKTKLKRQGITAEDMEGMTFEDLKGIDLGTWEWGLIQNLASLVHTYYIVFTDQVKFGEVVKAPPSLSSKPRGTPVHKAKVSVVY